MIIIEALEWIWKDSWFGKRVGKKIEEEKNDIKKDTLLENNKM